MKKWLLLLVLFVGSAHATAFVQSAYTPAASSNSVTLNGVSAKDLLVLILISTATQATPTGYTAANVPTAFTGNSVLISTTIYINTAPTAGTNTVTPTAFTSAVLMEFSGVSIAIDAAPAGVNNTGTSAGGSNTVSSGVLSQANEVVIAVSGGNTSGAGSSNVGITDPPTGFTSIAVNQNSDADYALEVAYQITSATTSVTASWTYTDTANWANQATMISLKSVTNGALNSGSSSVVKSGSTSLVYQ